MTSEELLEKLNGKDGIEEIEETPAGILITLKSEEPVDLKEDETFERVVQNGAKLELIYREDRKEAAEGLLRLWHAKEKLSFKLILKKIMDVLAGSLVPLMPMLMAAAMFKTLASVLGPDMLNVLSADSDLYTLLTFVGDAGFYFFPVAVGYTSAKVLGVTPILGLFLGGILIHPTFMEMAVNGISFSVYGIPITPLNYSRRPVP